MEKLRDFAKLATVISNDYRTNFEKFATVAREYYRAKKVNRDLEWPPCFAEKLVKLNMRQEVYDVYYNKQQRGEHSPSSIPKQELQEYDSVFITEEGQTQVTKILVEGDAGIGKTTLCTLISVDWAEHRKLQQYKLLLLLPLRDKRVTSVSSVVELLQLYHPNKFVCETVANGFLYRDFGKQVLIIADGWDELEESRQKEGFICELLFKNAIHSATVLITSRPTASVALHKRGYPYYIDHFVEIDGFDEKGIEQYIKSAFSKDWERKKQEGLLQQMKENPLLRSICQVPINCAIICHMWRHDETLPSSMTLTDLYTKIILHFMLRAFQKSFPLLGLESLINFDAIPQDMQECFWFLCKCAYDALKGDKYVFLKEDLKAIFPPALENQQNELFTFGLMQSTKAFLPNDVGMGTSFHFLHRMFQEYLSALHILKQPSGTHTELMKPYAYTSRMAIVMRFVVGLGSTGRSVSSKMFPLLCKTVCDVFEINYRLRVFPVGWTNDLVIHGIYEASKGPVKDYLSKLVFGDNFTFAFPRNAYDCATVVTAIDHFNEAIKSTSKNATTVSFKFDSCHLNENLLINLAVALYNTEGKLPVKTFIIQNNKLSDEAICMLMNLAALAFKSLKRLCLAANLLGAEAVSSISEYLKESSIEHLTLSYNSLGTSGILALQNVIKADSLANLTDLQLKNCSLVSSKLCAALFKVLSDHCTCLKQLDISENHLEDPVLAGKSIGTLLQEHKTLSDLYANEICLGEEGITALTNVILTNDCAIHISVLALQRNGIQSVGVSLLAKCIQSLHLSISDGLYLDGNSIKLEGVVSLSAVFNTKIISMSNCQLTSTGDDRECLMESLSKMPQIESCLELILDSNCFAGQYIRVLAEFIRICPKLSSLSCAKCQIDSKDLKYILNNYSLSELETWWLQENRLGDFGCSLLITAVKSHLQKVTGIFIHENANITNDRLFKSLDNEVAKHRVSSQLNHQMCLLSYCHIICFMFNSVLQPAGDIIEQVLTKVMPGVPYDKLKVLVKKYEAYDNHTDDEQDPVLLWDDYCRRGEEQRQLAEKIIGWTMSFKNVSAVYEVNCKLYIKLRIFVVKMYRVRCLVQK